MRPSLLQGRPSPADEHEGHLHTRAFVRQGSRAARARGLRFERAKRTGGLWALRAAPPPEPNQEGPCPLHCMVPAVRSGRPAGAPPVGCPVRRDDPTEKAKSAEPLQAKAFAYADYCTLSFRVVPISILHQMTTSMSSSPACHIAIGTRSCPHSVVNFEDEQQRRSSSSRLARAHERAGRGRARRASKRGTEDTPCPVVVRSWRSVLWGVTTSSMGRETPEPLAMRQQAGIVCELRKPLVQDKYSVKAKAQQLMYGFMGLYSIFRQRL